MIVILQHAENSINCIEEAVAHLEILSESDWTDIDTCHLAPDEPGDVTDEKNIGENGFEPIIPADVSVMIDVICKNDNTSCYENMIVNTEAGPSNQKIQFPEKKRKLKTTDFIQVSEKVRKPPKKKTAWGENVILKNIFYQTEFKQFCRHLLT